MVTVEGKPWFVAADVCRVLGLNDAAAGRSVRGDEKGLRQVQTPGGLQMMTTISRPGLSKLILRSDKPTAGPFQDWVTRDVLEGVFGAGEFKLQPGEAIPLPASFADALRLSAATMIKLAEEQEAHAATQAERDAAQAAKAQAQAEVARLEPLAAVVGNFDHKIGQFARTLQGVNSQRIKARSGAGATGQLGALSSALRGPVARSVPRRNQGTAEAVRDSTGALSGLEAPCGSTGAGPSG